MYRCMEPFPTNQSINQISKRAKGKTMKGRLERWLFWIERIGFLMMGVSWASNWDIFWKYSTFLNLFWECTNSLYLLAFIGKRLLELPEKQKPEMQDGNPIIFEGTGVSFVDINPVSFVCERSARLISKIGVFCVKNPGFLLERLVLC